MQSFFKLLIATMFFVVGTHANGDEKVDFNRQIRPILSAHCIACHGPDEGDRQADLRLDTFEGATEAAVSPGDAEGSDLIYRIETDDEDLRMPPADHASALKPDEMELLRRWIDQGAKYQKHWAFSPISAPAIPAVKQAKLGDTSSTSRVHNAIDNFILKRVYDAGLEQNELAKPDSLVRRASLDLTGLPPIAHDVTVQAAIEKYLEQPTQPNFGKLVDHLLESPAYAEHWASMWLDIARYADTCGYAGDEERDVWPWRDWLIRSLQTNKSYKELSREMLAGDLLPDANKQQQLATAFHRNTLSNNEGGTNDEEFRTIAVKDRLSTTLNAWMGLTVRCAECHSHKYDPISHKEYYQLLDFFNQTVDADNRDDRPKLELSQIGDPSVIQGLNREIAALKEKKKGQSKVWQVLRPSKTESRAGTTFELLDNDSVLATGPNPGVEEYGFTFELPAGETIRSIRLEALTHIRNNGNVGRASEGSFNLSQIRLAKIEPSNEGDEEPESNETSLTFAKATNDFNQPNRHARTAILADFKSGAHQGWAVNHPQTGYRDQHEAIFELKEPLVAKAKTQFKVYLLHDPPWQRLNMGCVRIAICDHENAVEKYDKKQLDPISREIAKLIEKRDAPVRVPVMQEREATQHRETFINLRGNFQSKGEKVSAQFPKAFPATSDEVALDRLGMTQWMFDESNPLTARVAVNRYWARLMGIGLVETEEDFGTQGTPPTHPELLDFMAVEFRKGGWDVRKLLKQIVTSATYQQSQAVSQKKLDVDPRNRLLARGPRVRLTAEVVRDQALAVSGLLSKKMYGKPVYPPNPIKRVVNAFTGGMTWQTSQGEDRNRRAIYTYYKRSAPHPLFETFDMSSRDVCSMRRLRTNTPLQSFMTLNDITFIEAARALAEKMLEVELADKSNADKLLANQIGFGVHRALYAPVEEVQTQVLSKLFQDGVKKYSADLKKAAEMVGREVKDVDPEKLTEDEKNKLANHASMTVVANVILNLDPFLNN